MDDHTQTRFGARLQLAMIQKGFSSNRSPYGVDVTHLSKITQHSPQICRKYLKNTALPSKEYGFIFQSSEIYDGLAAVYDYGPYGVELKNNIKDYWWAAMVQMHDNIVGLDASIFMHPKTWKASGHVDAFNDPLIDNKDSKRRFRADQLIEEEIDKMQAKADKEVEKAKKKFGDSFDEALYRTTNPRVLE